MKDQKTPLHYAAQWGRLDVTQLLVQSGANIEARDKVIWVVAFEIGFDLELQCSDCIAQSYELNWKIE